MASIERTAYPRYQRSFTPPELRLHYTLTDDERAWLQATTRGSARMLCCAVLLKAVQHLGYFPALDAVPPAIVQHLRTALDLDSTTTLSISPRTLYTYHRLIRERLALITTGRLVRHIAAEAVYQAAQVMDNPADLINVAIDALMRQRAEVPAFSTLDRLVRRVRTLVNRQIFGQILARLSTDEQARLDALLIATVERSRTIFNTLKLVAKRPSHHHLDAILIHLTWLDSLGQFAPILDGVPPLKIQHFCREQTDVAHQRASSARLRAVMTRFRSRLCAGSGRPPCVQHVTAPYIFCRSSVEVLWIWAANEVGIRRVIQSSSTATVRAACSQCADLVAAPRASNAAAPRDIAQ